MTRIKTLLCNCKFWWNGRSSHLKIPIKILFVVQPQVGPSVAHRYAYLFSDYQSARFTLPLVLIIFFFFFFFFLQYFISFNIFHSFFYFLILCVYTLNFSHCAISGPEHEFVHIIIIIIIIIIIFFFFLDEQISYLPRYFWKLMLKFHGLCE